MSGPACELRRTALAFLARGRKRLTVRLQRDSEEPREREGKPGGPLTPVFCDLFDTCEPLRRPALALLSRLPKPVPRKPSPN